MHHSVQRRHLELQAARRGSGDPRGSPRLRRRLIRPSLLPLFAFLGNGGRRGRGRGPVCAPRRHPDGDFAAGADPRGRRRDGDVLVVAEARYRAVRDARRAGPARGCSEVRQEGRMRALSEPKGDGHFLLADGLVEEAYVSVNLRKKEQNKV